MKKLIPIIAIILCIHKFSAQNLNHNLGIFIGTVNLQSDYVRSEDKLSFFTNNGISLSIAHYLSFIDNYSHWNQHKRIFNHLKVKTEIKYLSNGNFKHSGKYTKNNSSNSEKLRAMKGSLKMLDLGLNLEYFILPLLECQNDTYDIYLNPFLSFGLNYSFYKNGISSEFGNWNKDRTLLPDWYANKNSLDIGTNDAFSLCSGIGITSKLTPKIKLVTQASLQYFFSDSIDGLILRSNDYSANIQFGIIYHLN